MVSPWVIASHFLVGNREAELKPTTYFSLLLFSDFLSFLFSWPPNNIVPLSAACWGYSLIIIITPTVCNAFNLPKSLENTFLNPFIHPLLHPISFLTWAFAILSILHAPNKPIFTTWILEFSFSPHIPLSHSYILKQAYKSLVAPPTIYIVFFYISFNIILKIEFWITKLSSIQFSIK